MHFCLLTRSVLAHQNGGMEIHTEILRNGFFQRGHQVTVITTAHPDRLTSTTDDAGSTYFVGDGPPGAYSKDWWDTSLKMLLEVHQNQPIDALGGQGKALYHYLQQRPHLPIAQRIPAVIITHNTIIADFQQQFRQIWRRPLGVLKWLPAGIAFYLGDRRHMPQAEGITVLSKATAQLIHRWLPVEGSRIKCIPNGIDVQYYMPNQAQRTAVRQQLAIADDVTCIMAVGRLVPDKGQRFLLDALAHAHFQAFTGRYRLVVVGSGPARAELEGQAKRLGLADRVIFVGHVPHEQVAQYLNAADIITLPSLFEGVPLSLLEAMACAKPDIASAVGAIPSVVTHGKTGYIVPPGKVQPLARALATLAGSPPLAQAIGQAARAEVEAQYAIQQMVQHYCDYFEGIARHPLIHHQP